MLGQKFVDYDAASDHKRVDQVDATYFALTVKDCERSQFFEKLRIILDDMYLYVFKQSPDYDKKYKSEFHEM